MHPPLYGFIHMQYHNKKSPPAGGDFIFYMAGAMPISAVIKTDDNTGVLVGGTKMDVAKDYGKDLAVGSAAGATAGLVMSAISGGNIGRGTALGTAVGAGGGLVKSIWDKGNDVEIPANSAIELILTQPITVNPTMFNNNY